MTSSHYVRPHTRRDGTHVRGHYQRNPGSAGTGGAGGVVVILLILLVLLAAAGSRSLSGSAVHPGHHRQTAQVIGQTSGRR